MRKALIKRLLVRVPNWIGDAVMCEPALSAAARCFPEAALTILARPAVAALFEHHPSVHNILLYEHRGRHQGLPGKWALARSVRAQKFDAALLFQNAFEAALLSVVAGIPRRLGYATDGRGWLLTHPVSKPASVSQQVHYYLELLRTVGFMGPVEAPRLYLHDDERQRMADRLRDAGVSAEDILIGLNPGSTYGAAKRWLPERFAETADRLDRWFVEHRGRSTRMVIIGAAGEEALGASIAERLGTRALNWSGRTSIRELMALTERCALYVTNDTGPMHVAAAFGVPVLAVFGPTDWRTTAPFGDRHALVRQPVDCAPCLLRECPIDHRCMTRVTVDQVVTAAEGLLVSTSAVTTVTQSRQGGSLAGVTVYLDRDGTLIRDVGYLNDPDRVEWLPGVLEGLVRLKSSGARLVIVTNQSGVARGLVSHEQVEAIHARLRKDLATAGLELDGLYYCPHHPDEGCACRKPNVGMVEQSRREAGQVSPREYMIGDADRDIELGQRIGARTVRLGPIRDRAVIQADYTTEAFAEAVEWMLRDLAPKP